MREIQKLLAERKKTVAKIFDIRDFNSKKCHFLERIFGIRLVNGLNIGKYDYVLAGGENRFTPLPCGSERPAGGPRQGDAGTPRGAGALLLSETALKLCARSPSPIICHTNLNY